MTRYAAFLRGVNVRGGSLSGPALEAAVGGLGFPEARPVLASGNLALMSHAPLAEVAERLDAGLRAAFGETMWSVVVPADRLDELLDACPFAPDVAGLMTWVTLTRDPELLDELDGAVSELESRPRQVRLGPEATAWLSPVAASVRTTRSVLAAQPRYRAGLTDRTLRTVVAVRDALVTPGEALRPAG